MFENLFEKIKSIFICVNEQNSTRSVQCIATNKCRFRFTTLCETCKKNIGTKEKLL